jgi:hypothetical protein
VVKYLRTLVLEPLGVRRDEAVKGVGNGDIGLVITRKGEVLELRELAGDLRELAVLPRGRAIMIEQTEESLLFPALVRVEGPGAP